MERIFLWWNTAALSQEQQVAQPRCKSKTHPCAKSYMESSARGVAAVWKCMSNADCIDVWSAAACLSRQTEKSLFLSFLCWAPKQRHLAAYSSHRQERIKVLGKVCAKNTLLWWHIWANVAAFSWLSWGPGQISSGIPEIFRHLLKPDHIFAVWLFGFLGRMQVRMLLVRVRCHSHTTMVT